MSSFKGLKQKKPEGKEQSLADRSLAREAFPVKTITCLLQSALFSFEAAGSGAAGNKSRWIAGRDPAP